MLLVTGQRVDLEGNCGQYKLDLEFCDSVISTIIKEKYNRRGERFATQDEYENIKLDPWGWSSLWIDEFCSIVANLLGIKQESIFDVYRESGYTAAFVTIVTQLDKE